MPTWIPFCSLKIPARVAAEEFFLFFFFFNLHVSQNKEWKRRARKTRKPQRKTWKTRKPQRKTSRVLQGGLAGPDIRGEKAGVQGQWWTGQPGRGTSTQKVGFKG